MAAVETSDNYHGNNFKWKKVEKGHKVSGLHSNICPKSANNS